MTSEELLATIEQLGDCEFPGDDGNIPVSIFVSENKEVEEGAQERWRLTADNYMPRKGRCGECAYVATAPTREALAELVRTQILPLYQVAILNLEMMIVGTTDCLYYWAKPKERK